MKAFYFVSPITDPRRYVSFAYGRYYRLGYHTGIDVESVEGSPAGWPVYAVSWGVVTYAERVQLQGYTVWGNLVVIRHELPSGAMVWSRSAHVENMLVSEGEIVRPGQRIASVGNAYGVYAYHLHFDIIRNPVDPWDWPGPYLERVYRDYYDPISFLRSHVMAADYTALIAANQNVQAASAELDVVVKGLINEPPPPPTYTVMYVTAVEGVNVRTSCSTALNNKVGGLGYRTEVHVIPADGQDCLGWFELVDPVGVIAAGNVIYGANLSTTRPT